MSILHVKQELEQELEAVFRRILAVRYGVEVLSVNKKEQDTYVATASLDTDYLDEDSRIEGIDIIIEFIYEQDDNSSGIVINNAVAKVVDEFREYEFRVSNISGIAYRVALQAIVDYIIH
jgi:hypothetical protein